MSALRVSGRAPARGHEEVFRIVRVLHAIVVYSAAIALDAGEVGESPRGIVLLQTAVESGLERAVERVAARRDPDPAPAEVVVDGAERRGGIAARDGEPFAIGIDDGE